MLESKSPLERIYRLISSHTWMIENEAKILFVMMYASGTKSLGFEVKGLNQFMEISLEKMCLDKKENLQEYFLNIKDLFPNNEIISED